MILVILQWIGGFTAALFLAFDVLLIGAAIEVATFGTRTRARIRRVFVDDTEANAVEQRMREQAAAVRGAIRHPLRHPVSYATIDELMPVTVEVSE